MSNDLRKVKFITYSLTRYRKSNGYLGIRQWMINKINPSVDYNFCFKCLDTARSELTNQDSSKLNEFFEPLFNPIKLKLDI